MEDNIGKIKERVDIVDLIGSSIKLQKAGVNFKARCPFHNEKSGSFMVSPERQIWHCFGCGLGGDIFGFVQQLEGVEFPEALRVLAARAGVELKHVDPALKSAKANLYEICELSAKFFEKQLFESNSGQKALAYLRARAMTDDTMRNFRLGYAPDQWRGISDFLIRRFSEKDIADAGLAIRKSSGGLYDRFRARIMFPIFDANGQVVGFSGRIFHADGRPAEDNEAKYVNTPQTTIYDKGRLLYGFSRAKMDIRRLDRCLVVEGNVDVVLSHQAGATHAVATCGTALTESHLALLKRYTRRLDVCFDADSAGIAATEKAVKLALAMDFNIGVVAIEDPTLKDPADFVQKHGEAWREHALTSHSFLDYYINEMRKRFDLATASGKKDFCAKIFPFVAALASRIEQAHWISEIGLLLRLDEKVIAQEIASIKTEPPKKPKVTVEEKHQQTQTFDVAEQTLLSMLLNDPKLVQSVTKIDEELFTSRCRAVVASIRECEASYPEAEVLTNILKTVDDEALTMELEFVYLKSQELWSEFNHTQKGNELRHILDIFKKRATNSQLTKLAYDIKIAEHANNKQRLDVLLAEFSKVSRELNI